MHTWIRIERENSPKDLMVGPYLSKASAVTAMENSLLIEYLCQEDCIDCYTTTWKPMPTIDAIVTVDLNDPDHTGVGKKEILSKGPLRLMSYNEK